MEVRSSHAIHVAVVLTSSLKLAKARHKNRPNISTNFHSPTLLQNFNFYGQIKTSIKYKGERIVISFQAVSV